MLTLTVDKGTAVNWKSQLLWGIEVIFAGLPLKFSSLSAMAVMVANFLVCSRRWRDVLLRGMNGLHTPVDYTERKKNLHENKGVQIAVKVEIQLQARVQHFHCCFYYISCWVWIVGESPLHSLTKTGSLIQKPESQIQFFSWIDDLPRNKETRLRTGNTESQHLRFCSSSSQAKPCKISSKKASLYELSF